MLTGCGYQWGNRGSEILPGKYREIAVPMFKNKTQEVGSEVYFTNAIIEEIARSPNAITSSDKAEIVLEGELSRIEITGEGLANVEALPKLVELVSSYKLLVEVHIRVRRKSDQSLLFNQRFTGERTYASAQIGDARFNSANPNYNQSALHENLKIISVDLMTKAYNLMTESY
jgi:hypothetical protein